MPGVLAAGVDVNDETWSFRTTTRSGRPPRVAVSPRRRKLFYPSMKFWRPLCFQRLFLSLKAAVWSSTHKAGVTGLFGA